MGIRSNSETFATREYEDTAGQVFPGTAGTNASGETSGELVVAAVVGKAC